MFHLFTVLNSDWVIRHQPIHHRHRVILNLVRENSFR
jgi:hypothetical protein